MFFTYILRSLKDNKRYIGYTSDLKKRLCYHNGGLGMSTRLRRPLELVCFRSFKTKIEAIKYEIYLKSLKGGKQLELEIREMMGLEKNNQV